jgi:hypothetical protein
MLPLVPLIGPMIERLKRTIPTITLFHTVPLEIVGKKKVEMISQRPAAVLTNRAAGMEMPSRAAAVATRPVSQVFVNWALLWGQTNAEMNNHAPTAALRYLACF